MKILNNLYLHTIESMENKDIDVLNTNISMFLTIYETILEESKDYDKSEVLKQWIKYINFLGSKAIENGLFEELTDLLETVYKQSSPYELDVELNETIQKLINVFRESESFVELENIPIKKLLKTIYVTSSEELFPKFVRIYFAILKNKNLSEEEKDQLISNIVVSGMFYLYTEPKNRTEKEKDIFLIILYTSKYMIDNKDFNRFIKLLGKLKENLIFEEHLQKLYLYISCYLYYLGYKEELATERNYREFIKKYYENLMVPELIYSDFWLNYDEVKTILDRWEWYPQGEVKTLIMEDVVIEFFVFLSLSVGRDEFINRIEKDELFSFLDSNLNNEGNFREKTEENFKIFKEELMGIKVEDSSPELENLKYHLTTRFRKIKSEEYNNLSRNREIIDYNMKNIKECFAILMAKNPLFNRLTFGEKKETIKTTNVSYKLTRKYNLGFFASHKLNNSYVDKDLFRHFEKFIVDLLIENGFESIKIDYRRNDKLDILFNLIQQLPENKVNTLLSGISGPSLYNESETNKMIYQKTLEQLKFAKIRLPVWIAYNNEETYIRVKNINVNINSLTNEEIEEELNKNKVTEDLFKFHLTNNIFTFVNEEEAKEFLNVSKVSFSIDIELELLHENKDNGFIVISEVIR
ncbi:hypothetical protein [Bacillus dakarensis]|uniref:hypothetical protein n=1 Tax=Robertmurraya dakarensis TaxID=1926278 RepID=UPI000980B26B|nr:hypothetical protein [Bacillus dakarensis]